MEYRGRRHNRRSFDSRWDSVWNGLSFADIEHQRSRELLGRLRTQNPGTSPSPHLYVDVDVIVESRKVFRDVAEVNVQNKAFFSTEKEKKERTKRKRGRKQKKRAFKSTRTQLGFFDSLLRVPIIAFSIFSREPRSQNSS